MNNFYINRFVLKITFIRIYIYNFPIKIFNFYRKEGGFSLSGTCPPGQTGQDCKNEVVET
jgi:hypothetical protein